MLAPFVVSMKSSYEHPRRLLILSLHIMLLFCELVIETVLSCLMNRHTVDVSTIKILSNLFTLSHVPDLYFNNLIRCHIYISIYICIKNGYIHIVSSILREYFKVYGTVAGSETFPYQSKWILCSYYLCKVTFLKQKHFLYFSRYSPHLQ